MSDVSMLWLSLPLEKNGDVSGLRFTRKPVNSTGFWVVLPLTYSSSLVLLKVGSISHLFQHLGELALHLACAAQQNSLDVGVAGELAPRA